MPLVSVVIATYRRPEKLMRAIETVLSQTMDDLEIVVAVEKDDPDSIAVIDARADTRVRYVVNPQKGGPGVARDAGVRHSLGHWIAFLDDDDEWLPRKLELQLAAAKGREKVIVSALSQVVTDQGIFIWPTRPYFGAEPIDEWLFDRRTWFKGGEAMLQTSSLLLPRSLFDLVQFGRSRHEEWELVIRALKQFGYELRTVNEVLVVYYAGNAYPWKRSVEWLDEVGDLLTPRAIAGFCLNVIPKSVAPDEKNGAFRTLFAEAFKRGRPTAKQLFAFTLIWLLPLSTRLRLRQMLGRLVKRRASDAKAVTGRPPD